MTFSMAVICGNRLKRWNTMPIFGALAGHVARLHLVQHVALLPVAHELAVHPEAAGVDLLEVVDAAQQGGLAAARRAQQHEVCCGLTTKSMPLSTSSLPKDFHTCSALTIGWPAAAALEVTAVLSEP